MAAILWFLGPCPGQRDAEVVLYKAANDDADDADAATDADALNQALTFSITIEHTNNTACISTYRVLSFLMFINFLKYLEGQYDIAIAKRLYSISVCQQNASV